MTTSGTSAFSMTTTEIIAAAYGYLGVAQEGEALTPRMYADGLRSLNLLIQTWNAHPRLWIMTEGSLTMTADQPSYVVSPRALRILDVRRRYQGIDVPLGMYSRQEYFDQPNKTVSPSIPVNFYFDPQVDTGTIYLWPSPSQQTVDAGYEIRYTYIRQMDVMAASNNTIDMPQQWLEPVTWNLAKRLMSQYPVNDANLMKLILGQADETYQLLMQFDNEPASLFMSVEQAWDGYF